MMRKMCILLPLLLLPPAVQLRLRTKTYKAAGQPFGWKKARASCRKRDYDLITIRDETENIRLGAHGWIGLYRENSTSKWKWSQTDEIANFLVWQNNDPDAGEDCAFKYSNRDKWHSDKCWKPHYFTCYKELLVLVKEEKTWEEALGHCRALEAVDPSKPATAYQNYKYDLATLLTDDDHIFARKKAQSATTDGVWTGLCYLAGHWLWVGGEAVQYNDIQSCPKKAFEQQTLRDKIM